MIGRQFSIGTRGGPLLQVLSLLVFGVLLIGAVVMGAVVLVALLSLAVVASLVLAVRGWWLRRKLGRRGGIDDRGPPSPAPQGGRLIEGEYEVLEERDGQAERRRGPE